MTSKIGTAFIAVSTTFLLTFSLYNRHVTTLTATSPTPVSNAVVLLLRQEPHRHVSPPSSAVLLPDWLILSILSPVTVAGTLTCLFPNNLTSPANLAGTLTSLNLTAVRCVLPAKLRRGSLPAPTIVSPEDTISPAPELLRWSYLAYESLVLENEIVLFVKGINNRQGVNRPVKELSCLIDGVRTEVVTAVQEVFRCRRPSLSRFGGKISLEISLRNQNVTHLVPSVAYYTPPPPVLRAPNKSMICACTMVYNSAKFLSEWITYHASIGVERFILYDNDSDDDLSLVVRGLIDKGYDLRVVYWVWPKTQEAGFSHCAAAYRDTCTWMVYVDVDEFVYSPSWVGEARPTKGMLGSMVGGATVGQVMIGCYEFGPSDQKEHPREGVTQGYNCRMREVNRHKSIVLLDAVDESLHNVVHHFDLKPGYRYNNASIQMRVEDAIVNHYKYQAWSEFKTKYRRRVSAYVVDWTQKANLRSKDRAPGLGVVPVEPNDWPKRFCEVYDNNLRDLTRAWFGHQSLLQYHMAWQR